jgi:phosphatidylglycerophosphatase A
MTSSERSLAGEGRRGPAWAVAAASALGLGFTPRMPGTVGALVGVFLYLPAFLLPEEQAALLLLSELALLTVLAALAVPRVLKATGLRDPQWVVIDEVAGMLVALAFMRPDFVYVMLAFGFFRMLDIFKPFPVNRLEDLPGVWGVMMDDVAAGLLAGLLSILVLRLA